MTPFAITSNNQLEQLQFLLPGGELLPAGGHHKVHSKPKALDAAWTLLVPEGQ